MNNLFAFTTMKFFFSLSLFVVWFFGFLTDATAQNTLEKPYNMGIRSNSFSGSKTYDTNSYTNTFGRATNEIFLKFTLCATMEMEISHCGSEVTDTYLYLLDSNGNTIVSNDDYSGSGNCGNTRLAYIKRVLSPGVYYIVSEGYSQNGKIKTNIRGNFSMENFPALNVGSKSDDFNYTHSQNTANLKNHYSKTSEYQAGKEYKDAFYKLILTKEMDIHISQCSSTVLDSRICLFDTAGNIIAENDNYYGYGKCNNSNHAALKRRLQAGTYYILSEVINGSGMLTTQIEGKTLSGPATVSSTPSPDRNYIRTRTYRSADSKSYTDAIQYYDGLGRPSQYVQSKATPDEKDLVQVKEYDIFGRESKSWLPVRNTTGTGDYFTGSVSEVSRGAYYDGNAYTETFYEESPAGRVTEEYGPGENWRIANHSSTKEYLANNSDYVCVQYEVSGDNLVKKGNYASAQLYVTKYTDEDDKVSYEFRNKQDRVILQRQMDGDTEHDTYFVYDNAGLLRYVLPPLAADAAKLKTTSLPADTHIKNYAYIYKYDSRRHCIEKKLPGAEPSYYKYDKAGRMIFRQDGELGGGNTWYFSFPDISGRVVLEGICMRPPEDISDKVILAEYKSPPSGTYSRYGYTIAGNTAQIIRVLRVFYYDNYLFRSLYPFHKADFAYSVPTGISNSRYGNDQDKIKAKGLLTGTLTYHAAGLISDTTSLATVNYYDREGRMIQGIASNHLNGYEKEYIEYSFTGLPEKRIKKHSAEGKPGIEQTYVYSYDHYGRPTSTQYQAGTEIKPIIQSELFYDNLARVTTKNLHDGQESIRYSYSIRNQLRSIISSDYRQEITYNEPTLALIRHTPYYNGNVSVIQGSNGNSLSENYLFNYDGLNRLTESLSPDFEPSYVDEVLSYDKQGNITSLKRNAYAAGRGNPYTFDNLTLTYNGNQLSKVTDAIPNSSGGSAGFTKPSGSVTKEYAYNKNGSMLYDHNRGITSIKYNELNLPHSIQFRSGQQSNYLYDAAGVKRRAVYTTPKGSMYLGLGTHYNFSEEQVNTDLVMDYCGDIVYENGEVKYILTPEGYVVNNYNTRNMHNYFIKDYLGNNRVVLEVDAQNKKTVTQRMQYYPFGLQHQDSYYTERQPYKFGGKELDEMFGLNYYDQGARFFGSVIPVTPTQDPMAEKYYAISPYAQWGNNPAKYTDPTGMIWEEASLEEVNRLKENLTNRINDLNSTAANYQILINRGILSNSDVEVYAKEISAFRDMVSNLKISIEDIDKLGNDQKNTYALNSNSDITSGYVLKGKNGKISIVGDGMELTVHEITHIRQSLDAGKLNFDSKNNKLQYTGPGAEIQTKAEVEAYQMQFSVRRTDLGSGLNLRNPNEITPKIIGNMKRPNGSLIYPAINKYAQTL